MDQTETPPVISICFTKQHLMEKATDFVDATDETQLPRPVAEAFHDLGLLHSFIDALFHHDH